MLRLTRPAAAAFLVAALCAVAHANVFSVPFQFDDGFYLKENPLVTEPRLLFDAAGAELPRYANFYRHARLLTFLSLALNYRLGGWDPVGYHLVNLLVHLANALLLLWMTRLVLRTPRLRDSWEAPEAGLVAFSAAAVFATHPLATNVVAYTAQRSVSLATLWYLLAFCSYLSFRMSDRARTRRAWYALALAAALAGSVTREIVATLPLTLALAEALFFGGGPLRRRLGALAPLLPVLVIPAIAHATTGGGLADSLQTAATLGYFSRDTTLGRAEYLLTQARVLVTYWRLLFLPVGLVADYDQAVLRSAADPRVLASLALHLALLLSAAACLLKRGCRLRLLAFGVLWFYVTNSVESGLLVISETIFEYRAYLAAPGVIMAASALAWSGVARLCGSSGRARAAMTFGALALAALLAGMTLARNRIWQSELTLWEDVVRKSPASSRGRYNLGLALKDRGQFAEAAREFEAAVALDPRAYAALNNLGILRGMEGRLAAAAALYRSALAVKPDYVPARVNLGSACRTLGDLACARAEFEAAVRAMPRDAALRVNLGMVYLQVGRHDLAREQLRSAVHLDPGNTAAARLLEGLGRSGLSPAAPP